MADDQPFTLTELSERCLDAARVEIAAINHVAFIAASAPAGSILPEIAADIARQAEALALSASVMTWLKDNPAMALGLDLTELMKLDLDRKGPAP